MRLFGPGLAAAALALAGHVSANTEQLRFVFSPPGPISGDLQGVVGAVSDAHQNLVREIHPSFDAIGTDSIRIDGVEGRMYELRVCWPASQPTEFNLSYHPTTGTVTVSYAPEFYSSDPALMAKPPPVKYEAILNEVVYGVLPRDIVETVGLVVCAAVAGYFLSSVPDKLGWFS